MVVVVVTSKNFEMGPIRRTRRPVTPTASNRSLELDFVPGIASQARRRDATKRARPARGRNPSLQQLLLLLLLLPPPQH